MNNNKYPQERNLDGIYYRIKREGEYKSVCFTDMTKEEQIAILENFDREYLINFCLILAEQYRELGDELDIKCE